MRTKKKPAKKAKALKKNKGGRPTVFTKEVKVKSEKLSRRGFTDKEISEIIDVSERTINRWKLKHPEFCQSLNLWKEKADENIERSLYERAYGYSHPETKAQFVQGPDGGRWETLDMVKHYPPDPTSMIFWLKNRKPKDWRDKQDYELTGKDGGPIELQSSPEDKKLLRAIAKELFKKAEG